MSVIDPYSIHDTIKIVNVLTNKKKKGKRVPHGSQTRPNLDESVPNSVTSIYPDELALLFPTVITYAYIISIRKLVNFLWFLCARI